jgi:hypothetical protein
MLVAYEPAFLSMGVNQKGEYKMERVKKIKGRRVTWMEVLALFFWRGGELNVFMKQGGSIYH